ncbi:hypothetical protein GCM10027190_62770 [Spirosoma areae]
MALQVINFSVDPPDAYIPTAHYSNGDKDLSVNEMESIAEWILEIGLDQTDSLPEQDEPGEMDKITKSIFCWVSPDLFVLLLPEPFINLTYRPRIHFQPAYYLPYFGEIDSPPPQRV